MTESNLIRAIKERFYQFEKLDKNPIINFFKNERLRQIIRMMEFPIDKKSIILDLGCYRGYFSRDLSLIATTIGVDVDKSNIIIAKKSVSHIDFVCADISSLPFRNDSADIIICVSVLEHIENLGSAIRQIKYVLRKGGTLLAGFPIELKILRTMFRLLDMKAGVSVLLPLDSRTLKGEKWRKSSHTHKQNFQTVRDMISKHFLLWQKEKIPFTYLPDFLSVYECVKVIKK